MKLRTPLRYPGSKVNLSRKLVDLIPEHKIYVEVFGGTGALLFTKIPSDLEVYNDINSNLVNFFKILKDKTKFEELYRKLLLTPYAREEFYFCVANQGGNEIERARRFFVVNRQSYSGRTGWAFNLKTITGDCSTVIKSYLSTLELLPKANQRLLNVLIENRDFREIIRDYDSKETFFYLDPPYLLGTRSAKLYKHEMSDEDHKELIELLLNLKGKFMLSGYYNEIYSKLESEGTAQRIEFGVTSSLGNRIRWRSNPEPKEKLRRIECIWINYKLN